jgi:P pilus assembly chaperone PapD
MSIVIVKAQQDETSQQLSNTAEEKRYVKGTIPASHSNQQRNNDKPYLIVMPRLRDDRSIATL